MTVVPVFFFFQAEDGIRDIGVTGVQTCALPISATKSPLTVNGVGPALPGGSMNAQIFSCGPIVTTPLLVVCRSSRNEDDSRVITHLPLSSALATCTVDVVLIDATPPNPAFTYGAFCRMSPAWDSAFWMAGSLNLTSWETHLS